MKKQNLFANASRTLFRIESLVFMVVVGQEDVLGSGDLCRERDELKEKLDWYGLPSTLGAQIMRLKAYLDKREKCWNKASKDATQVCRAFEADQKDLQQKKDDQISALKGN
ncbi:unnamed protein product [Vicia faba]|uniref:Uncharacterized protein n=1 Tax=Vicia faba TaxID=3906 RepID=A0AAV0Z9X5_VICFA|nr:unnamed protein product [Vicia faba]